MKRLFIFMIIALGGVITYFHFYNSNQRLLNKIVEQKKYLVTKQKANLSVDFKFDPKWKKIKPGKEIEVNKIIKNTHNTKIYIERVGRQSNPGSLYILLKAKTNFETNKGEFIYINDINRDGTESSGGNADWFFYTNGKKLDINYGLSVGPGNSAGVFINPQNLKKIDRDTNVKFNGFKVYNYDKK